MTAPLIGMRFLSFLILLILGALAAAIVQFTGPFAIDSSTELTDFSGSGSLVGYALGLDPM